MKLHWPRCFSIIDAAAILVFMGLVVVHAGPAYESYKIRRRVIAGLELGERVKLVVERNAEKGLALDSGWESQVAKADVSIVLSRSTGIITVIFEAADIDGGGKSLTLIPVLGGHAAGVALTGGDKTSRIPSMGPIIWICTSSLSTTSNQYVLAHKGTLASRYAPGQCR